MSPMYLGSILGAKRAAQSRSMQGGRKIAARWLSGRAPDAGSIWLNSAATFYVFSGHKLYGPTGVGVLWASVTKRLTRCLLGRAAASMIDRVTFEKTSLRACTRRGSRPARRLIIEVIRAGDAAIDYVESYRPRGDLRARKRELVRAHPRGVTRR